MGLKRSRVPGALAAAGAGIALVTIAVGLEGCGKDENKEPAVPAIAESMISIPPGTFLMGSPTEEPGRLADEVPHSVTLTRPYLLCDHEVTQSEWQGLMETNDSFFHGGARPVESVSWLETLEFCNRLSSAQGLQPVYTVTSDTVIWAMDSNGYRLPTEAEWEYACRAESTSAFCNGAIGNANDDCQPDAHLDQVGWYCANYGGATHDVRGKTPNAWGLYDMHGNVWEWCWDWRDAYVEADSTDPIGPEAMPDDSARVARGGSWGSHARFCRSATRFGLKQRVTENYVGVRVARNAPALREGSAPRVPTRP